MLVARICASLIFATPLFVHATEYLFRSQLDQFTVDVSDGKATYNGQPVTAEPFVFIHALFEAQIEDLCDSGMKKPDLTIVRKIKDREVRRLVYFENRIVSDGKNCGQVIGRGLYQLPLHHNWFDGKKKVTIALGKEFSIWKDDRLVVEFKKDAKGWHNTDPSFFTNWDFFEKFVNTMREIPIDFRVHPTAGKSVTRFELRQQKRSFLFAKIGEKTWAVQFQDSPWLAASGTFGLFEDMDQKIWINPYVHQLKIAANPTANPSSRIKAIRAVAERWGPNIKPTLYDILLQSGNPTEVLKEAANVLRSHPTDENYSLLIDSMNGSKDLSFKHHVSKILLIRNPKGPVITPDDEPQDVVLKTDEWTKWQKTLSPP